MVRARAPSAARHAPLQNVCTRGCAGSDDLRTALDRDMQGSGFAPQNGIAGPPPARMSPAPSGSFARSGRSRISHPPAWRIPQLPRPRLAWLEHRSSSLLFELMGAWRTRRPSPAARPGVRRVRGCRTRQPGAGRPAQETRAGLPESLAAPRTSRCQGCLPAPALRRFVSRAVALASRSAQLPGTERSHLEPLKAASASAPLLAHRR